MVVVEDEDGDIAVSDVTSAVAEKDVELPDDQIEGVISIEDVSGLQSDGTGLVGDWLRAVVPATMGSFSNVIFYRDGKQLNSTTQNGAAMATVANRAGKYTVSVIGSDNKVYLSDSIDVVDTEAEALIGAVSIEDDYSTPNISVATTDNLAVISVSLNKRYDGTIQLYRATDLKFTGVAAVTESTVETATSHTAATDVTEVIAMPTTATVAALVNTGEVLFYQDPETGVTTYKFCVPGGVLVRGTEYKVLFDQDSITWDTPGSGTENVAEETITVPYLEEPASLNIDSAPSGQGIKVSVRNAAGATMSWMGNPGALAPSSFLSQLTIYSDKDTDMKDGTNLGHTDAAGQLLKGVITSNAVGTTDAFYYATAKTLPGIFGPKSIDLATTVPGKAAQTAADSISIGQNSSDPYSADIKFTNLRTSGTVVVLQSDGSGTTANATDDTMITGYIAGTYPAKLSATVTEGTKQITLSGAINDLATGKNHYQAVFIPDDTVNYSMVSTNTGATVHGANIVAKLTKYKLSNGDNGVAHANTSIVFADAAGNAATAKQTYIQELDQFGNQMTTAFTALALTPGNMTATNPTLSDGLLTTIKIDAGTTTTTNGILTITSTSGTAPTVTDGSVAYTMTLTTGQTLKATYKADAVAAGTAGWVISLS